MLNIKRSRALLLAAVATLVLVVSVAIVFAVRADWNAGSQPSATTMVAQANQTNSTSNPAGDASSGTKSRTGIPQAPRTPGKAIPISEVLKSTRAGQVKEISVASDGIQLTIRYLDESRSADTSRKEPNVGILELLTQGGVEVDRMPTISVEPSGFFSSISPFFLLLIPVGLMAMLVLLPIMRSRGGGSAQNPLQNFGKSKAKLVTEDRPTVTFSNVAGVEEAKQELQEVVEFLKYPGKFAALGAHIPRGVLLVGPPGTGKTLLSRAVAGEAGVPFFSISGSEFVEMFVGVGASRVRDLFDQAKRNAPCIIFIDEIDAVGRQRGAGLGGSHDEREQTLNQILVEMDGFDTNTGIVVLAATNRPDILDPALLRPGRFDRQVVLDRPDIKGRQAILQVHAKDKPLDADVRLETLAKQTPGFSGADLENLLNEAAILSARKSEQTIGIKELEEAVDRVISGPERKSRIISEREKAITAYHEVGHALVARMLPNVDPVHKVSIIARGMMGGYTRLLPAEDRHLWTKSQFKDTLAFALGGHVAEELIFNEITTGPGNDIERATNMARKMVCEYGMSKKLGPLTFGHKEELVFLGREISEQRNYSDEIAYEIDKEIKDLIDEAYQTAKALLSAHKEKLVEIAEVLIQKETLEGKEFEDLFDVPRPQPSVFGPYSAPASPSGNGDKNGEEALAAAS